MLDRDALFHAARSGTQVVVEDRPDAQPLRLDHLQQDRHPRRRIDRKVERLVGGDDRGAVGPGLRHLLGKPGAQRLDLRQFGIGDALRGGCRRQPFQLDPDLGDLLELADAHPRHPQRPVGRQFQRLLGDQAVHRLAHRHHAHAQRGSDIAQRNLLARHHLAGDQQFPQLRVDVTAKRLAGQRRYEFVQGHAAKHTT
ncbi:hypothetical protein D9M70_422990 [compost metagenome]